jgi:subtilisin family serine protease
MRIPWICIVLFLCLISQSNAQKLSHRLGEILIKADDGLDPSALRISHGSFKGRSTNVNATQICAQPFNVWKITFDHNRINEYEFYDEIGRHNAVSAIQRNYIFAERRIPNDTRFNQQWQYINDGSSGGIAGIDTDADLAWDITTGGLTASGDTIVVCVIDDGVEDEHEDLTSNMWINRAEIPNNGVDDDNNGYIDDYRGWDAIEGDDDITRDGDHGTSVVGIVAAQGNNMKGVAGVNWKGKVMMVRGGTSVANGVSAYAYAYAQRLKYNQTNGQEGAFVVATNASWGFENQFEAQAPILCDMYDALGEIGILNAAATTNENNTNVDLEGDLPTHCSSPYLISVTNLTKSGQKKSGAGQGLISIDMAAPGDGVVTTSINNGYTTFAGTSGSAPHVAGLIGLMYATPCSTINNLGKSAPAEASLLIKDIILGSVTQNDNLKDLTYTGGHLNIGRAVSIANELCDNCPPPRNVVANILPESMEVSWTKVNGAGTDVRYRKKGNLAWKTAPASTSPLMLTNLDECTLYEVQFRSSCSSNGPYSYSYYFETDNCCKNPKSLVVSPEGNDIMVSWEKISAAINYTLEFREVFDMEWTQISTQENAYLFSDINTCNGYEFRISTNCSTEALPFTFVYNGNVNCGQCSNAAYCDIPLLDNTFEYIESVSVNDMTFTSGSDLRGYGNRIGASNVILTQGSTADVSIVPGFVQGSFTEYMAIYVDWNQNEVFESSEKAFAPASSSGTVTGEVMVPMDALPGLTRARVILSYDDITGACISDGLEFGEVEDYCVTIQSAIACSEPVNIENISTTSTSLSLVWSSTSEAQDYTLEYRESGASEWTSVTSTTASTTVSGLTKCSTYEVRVRANCSGTGTSFSSVASANTRCGTSVEDPSGIINNYTISPNPFHDNLNIFIESNRAVGDVQVSVLNMNGRIVLTQSMSPVNGLVPLQNVDHLNSGIYLIRISGDGFNIVDKVIKL